MSGAIVPGAGELYLAGERMTGRPMYQYCRRGVVRKFQGTNVFQMMSVRENLEVAALGVLNRQAFSMRDLDGVLEQIGLAAQADMLAMHLPHGERQWLEIGMAMMCRPALLLLDEPAAGLSSTDAQRLVHLIHRLREQCAVLAIEHDLRFVQSLNCETWVMHRGKSFAKGATTTLRRTRKSDAFIWGRGKSCCTLKICRPDTATSLSCTRSRLPFSPMKWWGARMQWSGKTTLVKAIMGFCRT